MTRAAAPGKLVLTGAYAVLDGAPAIVCAVDRYAAADASRADPAPTAEVREALAGAPAPAIDVSALTEGGRKLGLGSSAAGVVAALGALAASRGEDLASEATRSSVFARARAAHARAQRGGSGVDVAASTFGGVLSYTTARGAERVELPSGTLVRAYFSGASARTTELRALVDRVPPDKLARRMSDLRTRAVAADAAVRAGDRGLFVAAAAAFGLGLEALGRDADAPIVPPAFAELGRAAAAIGAAFLPSGAGGGDVGVFIGGAEPPEAWDAAARAAGMRRLVLAIDRRGLHAP